jgi:rhamnogalacturonyl hydrolase YesR
MAVPFLLRYNELHPDPSLVEDCCTQIINMHRYLWDEEHQLHRHGYFSPRNEQSPVCWSRSNGWIIWAVSDALQYIPEDHKQYEQIRSIYKKSIDGLIRFQAENGLWHQILTNPDSFQETSASAMYTLAIARGVHNGWLPDAYAEYARLGWKGINTKINDGIVTDICRGTGIGSDEAFYLNRARFPNDPRGLGALITCAVEMDKIMPSPHAQSR